MTTSQTALIKKLKGLTPKDHDLASLGARKQMAGHIEELGADCTGAWSGTFEEYETNMRRYFPRRFRALSEAAKILVKNFGPIEWKTADAQLVYIYSHGRYQRTNVGIAHSCVGTVIKSGEPIKLIYRQSASAISGQRIFKLGNHRQCMISRIDGPNDWKRDNNYAV